jgi:hypothetical protein
MEYKTASPDRYGLLKAFARENRQNMTLAESVLWDALRAGSIDGHDFLRQYIIGDYIVVSSVGIMVLLLKLMEVITQSRGKQRMMNKEQSGWSREAIMS